MSFPQNFRVFFFPTLYHLVYTFITKKLFFICHVTNVCYLCKKYHSIEYDFDKNEELSQVNEPALAYEGSCSSVEERVAYMKKNLHPATVEFLEQHDFMVDKPFPYDEVDERWFDEADHENPAVSNDIVLHDKEVWLHA